MELTIDEALKKGVEAHKAGQVQEAEKLYTAIIQARSKHPDANHNMGVLAVGVGKIKEALPFFRIALETNSGIAQFWLSYVDALIKIGALDDARNMINQAKKKGIEGTIFCQLEQSIGQLNANGDRASSDSNNSTQSEVNVLDTKNLNQALRLAKKKAKDGFNADAKKIYQNIIDRFPRNSKALEGLKSLFQETVTEVEGQEPEQNQLQSLIDLYSKGQLQQVLAQAEQMLLRFPKSFSLYNILGAASAGLNKLDVAIDNYKQALNINPNHFVSYNNMGNALRSQGDLGAAIKSYKQAVKININYAEAYDNMGVALQEEGDLEAAIESYQQALKINPRYANAYNNIGVVLRGQGNLNGAIESYQKALKINPRYANAYNNLGVAQRDKGQLEAAIGSYQKAIKINPKYAEAYYNMGNVLRDQENLRAAIGNYKEALRINPRYAGAYNNMGLSLQDEGDLDAAINSFKQALKIDPSYAEVHRYLSLLENYDDHDEHFVQMESLYVATNTTEQQRCHLCFALGKRSNDFNNQELAFNYLSEGNALRKKLLGYNIAMDKNKFSEIKTSYQSICQNTLQPSDDINTPRLIFILGMPRSGTTLVEQIVSSHSEVYGGGELDYVARFGDGLATGLDKLTLNSLLTFRNNYLDHIKKGTGGSVFVTDKMPHNFRYIGLICAAFPEAKIIHVKRDPAATCWSNYMHYFAQNGLGYSYNLDDVVKFYNLYMDLMQFWQERYPDRIYELNYENLTSNQGQETRALIQYIGLDWQEACLSPQENKRIVNTVSQQQVRQKVYQGSSQQWKKFEPFLGGAFDELFCDT
jgi:tetratricopeptide (TPR) repeat protein